MRGWLSRWFRPPTLPDERAPTIFLLHDLSGSGISISTGRIPWEPGDRVEVRIRAAEGTDVSLWTVVQSCSDSSTRLEFLPHLPSTEVLATAAELGHAESIVLVGRDGEHGASY